jgi:hypothetical protein
MAEKVKKNTFQTAQKKVLRTIIEALSYLAVILHFFGLKLKHKIRALHCTALHCTALPCPAPDHMPLESSSAVIYFLTSRKSDINHINKTENPSSSYPRALY